MVQILNVFQIVISILLVGAILLQQRGGGLSPVFGGESGAYRTRRGLERGLFSVTIVLSVLFLVTAILHILLS